MSKNYIISGHSGEIDKDEIDEKNQTFILPGNVIIKFASPPGKVCVVPQDVDSMKHVVEEIKQVSPDNKEQCYTHGMVCYNYIVEFNNKPTNLYDNGVYSISSSNDIHKETEIIPSNFTGNISLFELVKKIQTKSGPAKVTIFCMFCRGVKEKIMVYILIMLTVMCLHHQDHQDYLWKNQRENYLEVFHLVMMNLNIY